VHEAQYAIDATKLKEEQGWEPLLQFEEGINTMVKWYLDHPDWLQKRTSVAHSS
jgi:dTDP-glucose 4,6-dehydratase